MEAPRIWRESEMRVNPNKNGYRPGIEPVYYNNTRINEIPKADLLNNIPKSTELTSSSFDGNPESFFAGEVKAYSKDILSENIRETKNQPISVVIYQAVETVA